MSSTAGVRVALFAAGALLVLAIGEAGARLVVDETAVLRWHDYGAQLKVEQLDALAATDRPSTVLIAGTSMAQQALVPDVLDRGDDRYYNAGLNGGVPTVMERWLLDQAVPRARPERVVWGLSSIDLSATYGEATDAAYRSALSTRRGLLAAVDRWVSRHSRFVASRAVLRDPSAFAGGSRASAVAERDSARAELGDSGERRNFTANVSAERAAELRGRIAPYALDIEDLAAIVRTVDDLRNQGIDVTLVELPVPPRFLKLYPDGAATHHRFKTALAGLARELEVEYIPLEDNADSFTDADFVDFTHLDEAAAQRFSRRVADKLD